MTVELRQRISVPFGSDGNRISLDLARWGVAVAAGRQVRMLASAANRDRAVRILQASFVEGRLAMDEFERRVGLAIGSRDFRELLALTADLPTGPFGRLPAHRVTPRPPGRRKPRGWFTRLTPRSS